MISVIWHYNDGFWDAAFPHYLLARAGECQHFQGIKWAKDLVGTNVGMIVIPGRHSTNDYQELNEAAANFKKIVFLIIGDEEGIFQAAKLRHSDKKIWWFMPPFMPPQSVDTTGPNGWPGDAVELIGRALRHADGRIYDYSFAGQVTHVRREQCIKAAYGLTDKGFIFPTQGFAQGMRRDDYYDVMVHSKFVLCPSGPCTPDSFRFAEALEAGCVPIVDGLSPRWMHLEGYWSYVFNDEQLPFPVITEWSELPDVMRKCLPQFDEMQRSCSSWWQFQKDRLVLKLQEDLCLT